MTNERDVKKETLPFRSTRSGAVITNRTVHTGSATNIRLRGASRTEKATRVHESVVEILRNITGEQKRRELTRHQHRFGRYKYQQGIDDTISERQEKSYFKNKDKKIKQYGMNDEEGKKRTSPGEGVNVPG